MGRNRNDQDFSLREDKVKKYAHRNREEDILIAGAGGQGVMLLGTVIAKAAILENKNVTYIRSYGAEMRGGTSSCWIRIRRGRIAAPIFDKATVSVMMNRPSFEKFKNRRVKRGILIANSSLIDANKREKSKPVEYIPVNELALNIGNLKTVNIIALGFLLKIYPFIRRSSVEKTINQIFAKNRELKKMNLNALDVGMTYGED